MESIAFLIRSARSLVSILCDVIASSSLFSPIISDERFVMLALISMLLMLSLFVKTLLFCRRKYSSDWRPLK